MDFSNAWINGRTLEEYLLASGMPNRWGKFGLTDRVRLALPQDLEVLGLDRPHGVPFVIEDNLLVTAADYREATRSERIDFTNLQFTVNAFNSAINMLDQDPKTAEVEALGAETDFNDPRAAFRFSEAVCDWGRGHRVWGNLVRKHHSEASLGRLMSAWLGSIKPETSPLQAIMPGVEIKGLGISFASKHLRLLFPDRFATLDDVLCQGLGYALNPQGFNLFISDLNELRDTHPLTERIADLEAGIFLMTRQLVRAKA